MNILEQRIFDYASKEGRRIHKPYFYGKIYDDLFSKFKETDVAILEIGIDHGGCLQMWKEYFGPKAIVYGIDHRESHCFEEPQIKCFVGEQNNRIFLKTISTLIPKIDILIDDGSHLSSDQITSFEELFGNISMGGIYVVEDTHTSYRSSHEGGYKKEGTFIEYCKHMIDSLYTKEIENFVPNLHYNLINSISFYTTLTVIKKK
jgi:cephalosporin hydroxylase